jgi:hypothetical protein
MHFEERIIDDVNPSYWQQIQHWEGPKMYFNLIYDVKLATSKLFMQNLDDLFNI